MVLEIKEIRRSYAQRKGKRLQVHFVICTQEDRYFHLVYDADKIIWILLYEFDDQMLFDEKEVDVEIRWNGLSGSEGKPRIAVALPGFAHKSPKYGNYFHSSGVLLIGS